jgi:hypothetical protein
MLYPDDREMYRVEISQPVQIHACATRAFAPEMNREKAWCALYWREVRISYPSNPLGVIFSRHSHSTSNS